MKPLGRSLNLSNSAAIIIFEAYRQLDFEYGE
jgi:tRNA (cytidine/uridine-2'-O-)-methyltransferase